MRPWSASLVKGSSFVYNAMQLRLIAALIAIYMPQSTEIFGESRTDRIHVPLLWLGLVSRVATPSRSRRVWSTCTLTLQRILQSNQNLIAEREIRHEIKWRRSKNLGTVRLAFPEKTKTFLSLQRS